MINSKELLGLLCTGMGEIHMLVGPPWCVRTTSEGSGYAQQDVVRYHMDLVQQELLSGIR